VSTDFRNHFWQTYTAINLQLSSSGTADFVARRRVLEIQDGSQITGSTNILETNTYHQNSKGEPTAFDHGKLAGTVPLCDSNNDQQPQMAAETVPYTNVFILHFRPPPRCRDKGYLYTAFLQLSYSVYLPKKYKNQLRRVKVTAKTK